MEFADWQNSAIADEEKALCPPEWCDECVFHALYSASRTEHEMTCRCACHQ